MEPSQNTISLKMIPRIDYDRIKARMSLVCEPRPWWRVRIPAGGHPRPFPFPPMALVLHQKDWFAKRKKFKRPPQRLFDAEKIR